MLTRRQKQIKDYVAGFIVEKEYMPTLEEIGGYFKIAASTAHEHLQSLKKIGYFNHATKKTTEIKRRNYP